MPKFNPALASDRDFVRLLIGDTGDTPQIQDATITALLARAISEGASAAGAPYCAASVAGEAMVVRWKAVGAGETERQVSKLSITRSSGLSADEAYRDYLRELKQKCTQLSLSKPGILKAW